MIRLKKLELTNFGPVEHALYEFDGRPGTYAIQAPNGSGKSHVIDALRALTSPVAGFVKNLGAYPRQVNGEAHKASISAVFDVHGDPLEVTRTITVSRDQDIAGILSSGNLPKVTGGVLAVYKGEKYKTDASVKSLMMEVTGIRSEVQSSAVFVMQNEAGAIWKEDDSTRIRMFQSLSGADLMANVHKAATQKLDFYPKADYTSNLESAESEVSRLEKEVADLKEKAASLPIPDPAVLNDNQQKLAAHRHATEQVAEQARSEQQVKALEDEARAVTTPLATLMETWTAKFSDEDRASRAEQVRDQLKLDIGLYDQAVDAYTNYVNRLSNLDKKIADLKNQNMASLFDPESLPDGLAAELESVKGRLTQITIEGNSIKQFLATAKHQETCPHCGSGLVCANCQHTIGTDQAVIDEKQRMRAALLAEYSEVNLAVADLTQRHKGAVEKHTRWQANHATIQSLEAQLADMRAEPEPQAPTGSKEKLLTDLANTEAWLKERNRVRTDIDRITKEAEVYTARIADLKKVLATMGGVGSTMTDVDVATCQQFIDQYNQLVKDHAEVGAQIKAKTEQWEEAVKRREDYREKQADADKGNAAHDMLQALRTAAHPNSIPREMAASYLVTVNNYLGAYCRELRLPFTLYIDVETMTLMYQTDVIHAPAKYHWSGGQFSLIAIVWHLTLNAIHGKSVGILVLDEPTNGLDATNRTLVAGLMETMDQYCEGAGLQMIYVSHDVEMAEAAGTILDLKGKHDVAVESKPKRTRKKKSKADQAGDGA